MSTRSWIVASFFLLLTAILLAAVLTPSLRTQVQDWVRKPGREVLASAEGDLLGDGGVTKVIKYKTNEGIWLEILKLDPSGTSTLVDRVLLPDKHDGLFNYQGHVTRLAIADIDDDGTFELLAPTFDQQLVPHLNVFRYNADLRKFEPYQAP